MNNLKANVKTLFILSMLVVYLSACATTPLPRVTEEQRLKLGKVGLVSVANAPKNEVDIGPIGGAEGAASGAGDTILEVVKGMGFGCPGRGGGICLLLLPPALLGGAAYGAISGAIKATPEDKAKEIETLLQSTELTGDIQNDFKTYVKQSIIHNGINNIFDMATNSEIVSDNGNANPKQQVDPVNTLLEASIVSVSFINHDDEGGEDPTISLQVTAQAILVDVKTKAEIFKYSGYTHGTGSVKFSNWKANNGKLLKEEFIFGCEQIANDIVQEIFMTVRTN